MTVWDILSILGEVASVAFVMLALPFIVLAIYETIIEKWGSK